MRSGKTLWRTTEGKGKTEAPNYPPMGIVGKEELVGPADLKKEFFFFLPHTRRAIIA